MTVSLCVVALNEEKYMYNLLSDFLNQTFPKKNTEIVLIDSGSSDNTKKIMFEFETNHKDEYFNVQVLDNINGIQSSGWNIAIENFKCDVIIRIDAHSKIPYDFVEKNVSNLENGEYISGGKRPCIIENNDSWGDILLKTENSIFGSSISKSRRSNEKSYVKSMFHAAYKREVVEKCGLFNVNLKRTEDNEYHYRIRKMGYSLLYDPNIVSYQYARCSLKKMLKQKFLNGYWIGFTTFVCPKCLSLYHYVPFCFLICLLLFLFLSLFGFWIPLAILAILYLCFCLFNSIFSNVKKFNPFIIIMPMLFFLLHISYGLGTLFGFISVPFKKRS